MDKFIIEGNQRLTGRVKISGAKNAALPILAGALLTGGTVRLSEVPALTDIYTMLEVLKALGTNFTFKDGEAELSTPEITSIDAPYEQVRKMRASFLVMGPLLARTGRARISLPGGCAIGARPIDLHLKGFEALGARIETGHGYIEATAPKLKGNIVYLDFPSVGATENIMMAAVLAEGQTIIENAAEEPEIVDLANFLNNMGAKIKGAGTKVIRITGVSELNGVNHTVIPDRIEAGTFMVAAVATKGEVLVENVITDHLTPLIAKLIEAGSEVIEDEEQNALLVRRKGKLKPLDIKTLPYPGFPTDLQAQMMALLTTVPGISVVTETVFENRFMHVTELNRMGAKIRIEGRSAFIEGVESLSGARVKATDLRAGAALVIAGLMADDVTEVGHIFHIDRGYEQFEEKLRGLGAKIKRVSDS